MAYLAYIQLSCVARLGGMTNTAYVYKFLVDTRALCCPKVRYARETLTYAALDVDKYLTFLTQDHIQGDTTAKHDFRVATYSGPF